MSIYAGWHAGKNRSLSFSIPRIWKEPINHDTDCFFCAVNVCKRRRGRNAKPIVDPNVQSSAAPVPRECRSSIPVAPSSSSLVRRKSSSRLTLPKLDIIFSSSQKTSVCTTKTAKKAAAVWNLSTFIRDKEEVCVLKI